MCQCSGLVFVWMLFLSPLVNCVIVSFRVFLTSSQSTRRASEAPSPQEGRAPGRAPGCLRATTGTVNTAIESVATTAGQWRQHMLHTHTLAGFIGTPPRRSASFGAGLGDLSILNRNQVFQSQYQERRKSISLCCTGRR